MDAAQVTRLFAWIRKLGADEGLELNLDGVRPVNSFDAHRVAHLAGRHGLRDQMTERLFRAHLTENVNVADHAVLLRIADEVGLDDAEVRAVLDGEHYTHEVIAEGRGSGVDAVPTFVVDRRYAMSGAQPTSELYALLEQARSAPTTTN
jgi:predicted DsbA family dithiol-disulfide isomerase